MNCVSMNSKDNLFNRQDFFFLTHQPVTKSKNNENMNYVDFLDSVSFDSHTNNTTMQHNNALLVLSTEFHCYNRDTELSLLQYL